VEHQRRARYLLVPAASIWFLPSWLDMSNRRPNKNNKKEKYKKITKERKKKR
jgi:hypothetical protein